MSIQKALLYLLLLLLPAQLGRHSPFPFSLVAGIRSDYLTPTIYLTDVIILFLISIQVFQAVKKSFRGVPVWPILFLFFFYLLFNSLFIAANKEAALYLLAKLIEYFLFGAIIVRLKPNISTLSSLFACAVLYVSGIAIGQFVLQRSIGGIFWFFGERTFYATTPGIAAVSLGGRLLLRPYAIFPHPNVLGGFLAVILPFIFFWFLKHKKEINIFFKSIYIASFSLGGVALFLSFSRSAWLVFLIGSGCFAHTLIFKRVTRGEGLPAHARANTWSHMGDGSTRWQDSKYNSAKFLLKRKKELFLAIFYVFMFLSAVIPLGLETSQESVRQRKNLLQASIQAISSQPLFGIGLNNSVVRLSSFLPRAGNLSIFQPVHNIYVFVLVETGLFGFTFFLLFLTLLFNRVLKAPALIRIALIQLLFLGFFDHYLLTLQQGQLVSTLFISLAFLEKNT